MRWLAHRWLTFRGWTFHGILPPLPKMIVVGAPHTSNWDFALFLAALHHYEIEVRYLGKHTLFRPPIGWFMEATGGIPVDRSQPGGVIEEVTNAFAETEEMVLVIAPEGTRKQARWWKSGFLKIAEAAAVPVVLVGIDYSNRRVTIGPTLSAGGDTGELMDMVRQFYADKRGLHPELETPVVLREEGGS